MSHTSPAGSDEKYGDKAKDLSHMGFEQINFNIK
jgi:hypothetical protein